ncbi:acyltransferase family protein [Actinacidiphila paucisporea]|uniref:Peptidoglycan/LPS O-acetylase OafA/YrhL, contains acyltransferase and SGNH-hydrolase domains n=1 Tax=Actinacidiphila paucisporea TaxID=310782 RepID=A0A1M7R0I4_9ACTN|nr:acyltransferase [Actinacidiphila paucisporea]SHN38205.1 Peptidoglycan/LPS O-acetylase OafA/YrhL, contains acyltransferase and SGNH-hydrolase domains [Actinacidiphila paucisporea]
MATQAPPQQPTPSLPQTSRPAPRNRLHSLTGMRAVAAAMVFVFHTTQPQISPFTGTTAARAARWFTCFGPIGVSFFFVLSGFVLTWAVRKDDTPGRFYRRRLVRIYPNHVVTFAAALVLFASAGVMTGTKATTPRLWLPNLFLLHAWTPHLDVQLGVNPPSWSLSCEALFYLCFPLLYALIRKIPPRALWATAGVITALVVAVPALAYAVLPGVHGAGVLGLPVTPDQLWLVYVFPPARLLEFALGMVMARIVLTGRWVPIPTAAAALLAVGGYFLTFSLPFLYRFEAATIVPLALLIPAAAAAEGRGRRSVMRSRVMVRLGDLSFAFFMIHAVMLVTLTRLFAGHQQWSDGQAYGVIAAYATLSLAAAWVLNTFVERPMVRHFSQSRALRATD